MEDLDAVNGFGVSFNLDASEWCSLSPTTVQLDPFLVDLTPVERSTDAVKRSKTGCSSRCWVLEWRGERSVRARKVLREVGTWIAEW
jgi:hypothetical protein